MKEAPNELASHNSSLNLGSEEMPNKEYVQLAWGDNMAKLMDLAWGREVHLGLVLSEEPMEGNDVDDPTPIVKRPKACVPNYYQIF